MFKKLLLIKWGFFISYLFFFTPQLKLFMDDLIVITAHCPTEQQEKMLEKCVDSVLNLNYHVALISHTHIPIHIQKKCNYYFYDYHNDINYDDDLLFFVRYVIDEKTVIRSKYFTKEFYGFAIYRMFSIASQIAINFGYKNIHHIEYDCILKNTNLIDEHKEILKEYGAVVYTDTGKEDGFVLGAFKSFAVDKLPTLFKNYNKDKMRELMINIPLVPLEVFTKHILLSESKPFFKCSHDIKNSEDFIQNDGEYRLKHFTPYYNHKDDTFCLFYKNIGITTHHLKIYVNNESIILNTVDAGWWTIRKLCKSSDLKNLLILCNDNIIYNKTFNATELETLKKNAYVITNEENN